MKNNKFNCLLFVIVLSGLITSNAQAADPSPRPASLAQKLKAKFKEVVPLITAIEYDLLSEDKIDERFRALGAIDSQEVKKVFEKAVTSGTVKAVKYFLRKGFSADEALIIALKTPFYQLTLGKREVTEDLKRCIHEILNFGAKPNATDAKGNSCLTIAMSLDVQIVNMLIERGADVGKMEGGFTPLHKVVFSSLHPSSKKKISQSLIDNKADIEALDGAGRTPLLTACSHGEMEMASIFIELGADKNFVALDGARALTLACGSMDVEPCFDLSFLLSEDAEQRKALLLSEGNNPLRVANESNKFPQLRKLLIQIENDGGSSAKAIKDFDLLKKGAITLATKIEGARNDKNSRLILELCPSLRCSSEDAVRELSSSCKVSCPETGCLEKFHYYLLRDFMKIVLEENDSDNSPVTSFYEPGFPTQVCLITTLEGEVLRNLKLKFDTINEELLLLIPVPLVNIVLSYMRTNYWAAPRPEGDSKQNPQDD